MLFLVTCATIAGCDGDDETALWGDHHVAFLRGHSEYHFGTPKEDWLRTVLNRIDPALFEACFTGWALSLRSDAPDLIALDGKSLRRSGDGSAGTRPLHLVSAWASSQRLVLAQEPVETKENECAAMLAILRLDIKGALVTIIAIATNPAMAATICLPSSATRWRCIARSTLFSPTRPPPASRRSAKPTRITAASRLGQPASATTWTG